MLTALERRLFAALASLLDTKGHHPNCPAAYLDHAPCSPACGEARALLGEAR